LRALTGRLLLASLTASHKNIFYFSKILNEKLIIVHVIEIDTEKSMEKGIFFFGNRFTDVLHLYIALVHGKMVLGMERCLLSVSGSVAENDMGFLAFMIESSVVKNQRV